MFSDSQLYTFSNVHIKLYNQKNKRLLKEYHKKNTVTKLALNGIASMIKGEFNDTNYNLINSYVPKYLALGTNNAADSDESVPANISESVSVTDTCLLSEITKNGRLIRVRLEDVKRESDTNDYIKIRFRTLITSGTIPYSSMVQELGLFVDNSNLTNGLFARIATEPITIPENSVLDVTWDVVLASSVGVLPTIINILNAEGDNITDNVDEPQEIESYGIYGNVYPLSVNLESSIIDGVEIVSSYFTVTTEKENNVIVKWISTNNFNRNIRTITRSSDKSTITITDTAPSSTETKTDGPYQDDYCESLAKIGTDSTGATIDSDGEFANKLTYKDVTYRGVNWSVGCKSPNSSTTIFTIIPEYKDYPIYEYGNPCIYNNNVYLCIVPQVYSSEDFDETKWKKAFTIIKYMSDCIIINYNVGEDLDICIGATTYNKVTAYTYLKLGGTSEIPGLIIVPITSSGGGNGEISPTGVLGVSDEVSQLVEGVLSIDDSITRNSPEDETILQIDLG